jgi:hypothetical protein
MVRTRSPAPEGQDFTISSLPPTPAQRRLALGVVLVLIAAFVVAVGPLSTVPLPRIDSFIPMYATAMFVNDSITAVLLFAQFSILRSHALLVISSGYLFTALILIPWVLTFPGSVYSRRATRRRAAEHGVALLPVACRLSHVRDRLCAAEEYRSVEATLEWLAQRGNPFERCRWPWSRCAQRHCS